MLPGFVLAVAALALRGGSTNRHVRGRLLASAALFALNVAAIAVARSGYLNADLQSRIALAAPLLLALGVINALVALAVNPWRDDRVPERFPRIVQDSIVIAAFALAAVGVLRDRVFALTAAGAVVIGLALQDTLGNFFAGLAIQVEKPFRVGHWVRVAGTDARVQEVTWRATKLRTKTGNLVVVPNSALAKDTIVNYSEPSADTRLEVDISVGDDVPPNRVKATVLEGMRDVAGILGSPAPEVLLLDFGESAIAYRVRFWTTDFTADERLKDAVRTATYYAFNRAGIPIPSPVRMVVMKPAPVVPDRTDEADAALARVPVFAPLPAAQRAQIAAAARCRLYGAGDIVVRQGEEGRSMFVLLSGETTVLVGDAQQEVARIQAGGFFGEMSLLTGAPRNATVRAMRDAELLEITAEAFRTIVLAHPAALEAVAAAAARRQAELDQARAAGAGASADERTASLMDRVRKFFTLEF